jgi:ParB family chromosome partitioning protein
MMTRKTLGRGLDALFESTPPLATPATSATPSANTAAPAAPVDDHAMLMVSVDRISPGPFQPRRNFDPLKLQELTRAIASQGIIEPLIVRLKPDHDSGGEPSYELIAGERRLRAARAAGLTAVPVVVRRLDDRAALEMSLVENIAREDLNAIEEGRAFQRLSVEFGLNHEEIAARVGKSRPYVSNAMRLLELAPEVLAMVERGELSPGLARPLLAISPPAAQIETARQIVQHRLNARGVEQIATTTRAPRGNGMRTMPREPQLGDPNLRSFADSLQKILKRRVRIVRRRGRSPGRIEIDFYDDQDLNNLAKMLLEAADISMRPRPAAPSRDNV